MATGENSLWIADYETNMPFKYDFVERKFKQQGVIKVMNMAVG